MTAVSLLPRTGWFPWSTIISYGFEMEHIKVETIHDWQPPCTVRGVQEFTGFCNFYWCFVKNFTKITQPLHDLTKDNAIWQWGPWEQHAFKTLKAVICTSPVLIHADPDERLRVETDASNYAYGAILSQIAKQDNKWHPVAFFSKSTYDTGQKKLWDFRQGRIGHHQSTPTLVTLVGRNKDPCQDPDRP